MKTYHPLAPEQVSEEGLTTLLAQFGHTLYDALHWLDAARDGGAILPVDAQVPLMEALGIPRDIAHACVVYWMSTFEARHPVEQEQAVEDSEESDGEER